MARGVRYRKFIDLPDPRSLRGPSKVKVGFPAGEADGSNIDKAFFNEFGTKGSGKPFGTERGGGFGGPIPERPFMRNTMRSNRTKYLTAMKTSAVHILRGSVTIAATLQKLGVLAVRDIQKEIVSLTSPGNSPVTIAIKGSSNPLIDTGEMRQSVTYKIDD